VVRLQREGETAIPNGALAEAQVAPQVAALLVGALEVQAPALEQPLDLEGDVGVDHVVEVARRVLERERVRVVEMADDHEVQLRGQMEEGEGYGLGRRCWKQRAA
jgi:hypothetical protein